MIPLLAKLLLAAGATGGAGWLISRGNKLVKLNTTSKSLEVVSTAMLHKLDLKGVTIHVDVNLKNPSQNPITLKFPFIKLAYNGATIGTSKVVDRDIIVPKWGEAVAEGIMITVPFKGIFSLAGGLIQSLQSGAAVKLNVIAQTNIDMGKNKKPLAYEKAQEVTLKKEAE